MVNYRGDDSITVVITAKIGLCSKWLSVVKSCVLRNKSSWCFFPLMMLSFQAVFMKSYRAFPGSLFFFSFLFFPVSALSFSFSMPQFLVLPWCFFRGAQGVEIWGLLAQWVQRGGQVSPARSLPCSWTCCWWGGLGGWQPSRLRSTLLFVLFTC